MKKLTVITVCYNEPNLEETCKSIIGQTWQDFEWIVIDGGSSEETQKIWDKYKFRINKFISEPDTGRYNAMNKGIRLSSGEYLNFLNAGDSYFYNNVLKDIFANNMYSGDVLYGYQFLKNNKSSKFNIQFVPKEVAKDFLFESTIPHQASFIKKELFEKYGFYNENYKVVSDYEYWFRLLDHIKFEYLPYIVTTFDTGGISSNKKGHKISTLERLDVINKYFDTTELNTLNETNCEYETSSFLEQIFSIKNNKSGTLKIITFLGMHIKLQRLKNKKV